MHYAFVVVWKIVCGDIFGSGLGKIAPISAIDVFPVNGDVIVPVRPGLFVKESDYVKQFVLYDSPVGVTLRGIKKKKKKSL